MSDANLAHLRPLPDPSEHEAELPREVEPEVKPLAAEPGPQPPQGSVGDSGSEVLGLTHPSSRGRGGFVTDVLVELGFVTAERVEAAIAESRNAGKPPERILLEQNAIDSRQLSRAIAERYGLDHVDLSVYNVDMAAANLLPIASARRYQAIPIGYADTQTLLVAMADPANVLAADD